MIQHVSWTLRGLLIQVGWPEWCADVYAELFDAEMGRWLSMSVLDQMVDERGEWI